MTVLDTLCSSQQKINQSLQWQHASVSCLVAK